MEEEKNLQSISSKTPLGIGQKVLAAVLVFSAVIVFFFGVWQFKQTIKSPFEREASSKTQASDDVQQEDISVLEMQNKDTDQDGLSDYEEFYIYKTSPYLADSDSDNIDDKKEIDAGSNPNCHDGQDCAIVNPQDQQENSSDAADNVKIENKNAEADLFTPGGLNDFSNPDSLSTPDLSDSGGSAADLFGNLSVSEIRELLKESGMPSEILDQLTDEQILEAYKTTLENMNEVNEVESP